MTYRESMHLRPSWRIVPTLAAFSRFVCYGLCGAALLSAGPSSVRAGGGPQNVLVVVNDNSQDSLELGQYYQEQRGISESRLLHVSVTTNDDISLSGFTTDILQPIEDHLAQFGLSNQIDYVVYTPGIPYRVIDGTSRNGITSATYYGFKTYPNPASNPCSLPGATSNDYLAAETAFHNHAPVGSGIRWISAILTATNVPIAKTTVDRSVLADNSDPTGTVYYVHTSDELRNLRWPQFENADFVSIQLGTSVTGAIVEADYVIFKDDVAGYMLGSQQVPGLPTNPYLPGTLADHLTSFGGFLYGGSTQRSILDWLEAGCVGSYGTVVEPCNFTNKFPRARVHAWYQRGFSMGESYTMSIESPYMGVIAGDPLCAPYAQPAAVMVAGLATNEVVTGLRTATVSAVFSGAGREVSRVDAFVDDVFVTTLTNAVPLPGDQITVTIDGDAQTYTVQPADSLTDIAAGLAASINAGPQAVVTARASGDRVELIQDALGVMGSNIAFSAAVATAADSSLWVRTSGSALLESSYPARQLIQLTGGTPRSGDELTTVITRTDGVDATTTVTQMSGDTLFTFLSRLADAINADPVLQADSGCEMKFIVDHGDSAEGYLVARTNGWDTYNLHVDYTIDTHPFLGVSDSTEINTDFAGNRDVLSARGTVFPSQGRPVLSAPYVLNTSAMADGPHTLTMVAYEGTAVEVQGRRTVPFVVDNHDLACEITVPATGNAYLQGQVVDATAIATASPESVTSVTFYVEGKPLTTDPAEPFTCAFNTLSYGIGTVGIQALAEDDGGRSTWSERVDILVLSAADEDGDGLPDGWEILHFGDIETYDGADDPDMDDADNTSEFIADTDPDDGASRFRILSAANPSNAPPRIAYASQPTRDYLVESLETNLVDTNAWAPAMPAPEPGLPGSTTWIDTNAPPAGDALRAIRVRAFSP